MITCAPHTAGLAVRYKVCTLTSRPHSPTPPGHSSLYHSARLGVSSSSIPHWTNSFGLSLYCFLFAGVSSMGLLLDISVSAFLHISLCIPGCLQPIHFSTSPSGCLPLSFYTFLPVNSYSNIFSSFLVLLFTKQLHKIKCTFFIFVK